MASFTSLISDRELAILRFPTETAAPGFSESPYGSYTQPFVNTQIQSALAPPSIPVLPTPGSGGITIGTPGGSSGAVARNDMIIARKAMKLALQEMMTRVQADVRLKPFAIRVLSMPRTTTAEMIAVTAASKLVKSRGGTVGTGPIPGPVNGQALAGGGGTLLALGIGALLLLMGSK